MRFATSVFTFLSSFALLLLMLEAGEADAATNRIEPFISVFDAAGIGLGLWVVNAFLVFRFPKVAAALYVLAGTVMLAFGFLDFGTWNTVFVFGVISFAFAAMAWASWLVQVLWTEGARPKNPLPRLQVEESLVRG